MSTWHRVATVDSLAPGEVRTVEVLGRRLALAHVDGGYYAIDDRCPHRGAPLGEGFLNGRTLHCPLHGWGFDVTNGSCETRRDCPVASFAAERRGDEVWVSLDAKGGGGWGKVES